MSNYVPESNILRISLRFCFFLKKNVAEAHRMLVEAYGHQALSEETCRKWYHRFRRGEFDISNEDPEVALDYDDNLEGMLDENEALVKQQIQTVLNTSQEAISMHLQSLAKIQENEPEYDEYDNEFDEGTCSTSQNSSLVAKNFQAGSGPTETYLDLCSEQNFILNRIAYSMHSIQAQEAKHFKRLEYHYKKIEEQGEKKLEALQDMLQALQGQQHNNMDGDEIAYNNLSQASS